MKLGSVKLLTDENVSPRVVTFLRSKGFGISDVKELGWQGREDKDIMGLAHSEKRLVLTHDADFGTLAVNEGVPCYGIIYLRLKNLKISNVTTVLDKLLSADREINEAPLIVVEDARVRIRTI